MSERRAPGAGWRPLRAPRGPGGPVSPFARLARTHALSVAGDTLITLALADSIFFGISPSDARPKVLLYLLLTVAPFAVVAPLLGPWIDSTRGGRRLMLITAAAGRAAVAVLLIDDIDGLLLFPEAFVALVLAKSHSVARSALVPTVVRSHDALVEANSKLSILSGITGLVTGIPGLLVLWLGGAPWVLALAAMVFAVETAVAFRVPKATVAESPPGHLERAELRGAGVLLAATAMATLRGLVGFLTFHVAFFLRTQGEPTWWFGVVIGMSAAFGLAGAAAAAPMRRVVREEHLLVGALGLVTLVGLFTAWSGGGAAMAAVMASAVAFAAAGGKTAFDSIVQRDAPDANQGRSFARFETRFQMAWVVAAVVPVMIRIPDWAGFLVMAAAAGFAAVSYVTAQRATQH